MDYLSNEMLLNSYKKALELGLSKDFIILIIKEIRRRNLTHKIEICQHA